MKDVDGSSVRARWKGSSAFWQCYANVVAMIVGRTVVLHGAKFFFFVFVLACVRIYIYTYSRNFILVIFRKRGCLEPHIFTVRPSFIRVGAEWNRIIGRRKTNG